MSKVTVQDRKDLSKALNYANWSILGLLIPFVGIILGSMGLSFIKTIPYSPATAPRARQVYYKSWAGIILSIISIVAWAGYFKYQRNLISKHQNQIQQEAQNETAKKFRATEGLNNCINVAVTTNHDGFKAQSESLGRTDGLLPMDSAKLWDQRLLDAKNECYTRFNAGLFDYYVDLGK